MDSRKANHSFGTRRGAMEKFMFGCCILSFLLLILIFPIILFSEMNPAVELNNIFEGEVRMKLLIKNVK